MRNNITCTIYCNHSTAVNMVCDRYITVNTLHKGNNNINNHHYNSLTAYSITAIFFYSEFRISKKKTWPYAAEIRLFRMSQVLKVRLPSNRQRVELVSRGILTK
jgi:hypothetical protein